MSKKMLWPLACLVLSFVGNANASTTTVGDGGYGLLCTRVYGAWEELTLLDFVEHPFVWSTEVTDGEAYLEVASHRMAELGVDPALVRVFRARAILLYEQGKILLSSNESGWVFGVKPPTTSSKTSTLLNSGRCKLVLLAWAVRRGSEISIHLNRDYSRALDVRNLAGLVVHESLRTVNSRLGLTEVELMKMTSQLMSRDGRPTVPH